MLRSTWRSASTSSAAEQRVFYDGRSAALPAIEHALSAFPAALARRAMGPIRLILNQRLTSGSAGALQSSRLTGDGFPFELAFSTGDDRLRFTIEPDGGALDPHLRLDLAGELMRTLGEERPSPEVWEELRAIQATGPLAYGAWMGFRVGPDRIALKLYVEVPRTTGVSLRPPSPVLPDRVAVSRMVGYAPATGVFETYFRIPSLEPHHLPAVLAPAGMEVHASWLADLIQDAYGHVIRGRLPGPSVGVSYAAEPGRTRITLHFYARALWGSDARIRQGWSRLATSLGWDDQAYLQVTQPLAGRESWRTFHGLVGIALDAPPRFTASIGMRPVLP